MSQPIRFKVWNEVLKRWVGGDCYIRGGDGMLFHWQDGKIAAGAPHYKVIRFTGLKDKTGKEIWEGDVVRWFWDLNPKTKMPVYGPAGEVVLGPLNEDGKERTGWFAVDSFIDSDCEVIGNVWENPELVKP